MNAALLALIVGSYLLGSIPTGVVLAAAMGRQDIRTAGSGNIGATNAARVLGKKFGACTFLGDMLKGYVPVLAARMLLTDTHDPGSVQLAAALCGCAAFIGHLYPIYLRFRGGKGVATACGIMLALEPAIIPVLLIVFIGVAAVSRYVSLASLVSACALPLLLLGVDALVHPVAPPVVGLGFAMGVLVFIKHRSNIERLVQGTESRIGSKKTAAP